jgi:WD40 repeat protein
VSVPVAVAPVSELPFPGLRPFLETESHLFFGREGQTQELLRRLEQGRHLAVLGTSGSGKSSLVYAGLVPALRGDYFLNDRSRWRIVAFRPKGDPLGNLAATLAQVPELRGCGRAELHESSMTLVKSITASIAEKRWNDDTNLLIIVDQFEELFRYDPTESPTTWDERASFVKLLIEGTRAPGLPLYVVLTMRSEYLGDCAQFRDLPETINDGQYLIPRMTRENWRAAIEGPLRLVGVPPSPALVQRLLNDVTKIEGAASRASSSGDEADALPLLQHALNRTWDAFESERAKGKPEKQLLLRHYSGVGGIEGALSRHLDEALARARHKVGADADRIAERVFQRLRTRDVKGREARAPLPFGELVEIVGAPAAQVGAVLDCFRDNDRPFLTPRLASDDSRLAADPDANRLKPATEIDITHECLLRRWNKLKVEWITDEEESRRNYVRLAQFKDEKEFVAGTWLTTIDEWWHRRQPTAAWAKRYDKRFDGIHDWLEQSKKKVAEAKAAEVRRVRRERRFWRAIGGVVAAAALLGVYGYFQYVSSRNATRNWHLALTQLFAAKAQMTFLDSSLPRRTSAMLAAASVKYSGDLKSSPLKESRDVLASALPSIPRPLPPIPGGARLTQLAGSDDGTVLAAAGPDGTIVVEREGAAAVRFQAMKEPTEITISRDNRYVVLGGNPDEGAIEVWDVNTGTRVAAVSCDFVSGAPILSPDSSHLLAPCNGVMQWSRNAWQGGTGTLLKTLGASLAPVAALAYDREGKRVAVAGEAAKGFEDFVYIYELPAGKLVRSLPLGTTSDVTAIHFLFGDELATVDESGLVRVWPRSSGEASSTPPAGGTRTEQQPPELLPHGRTVVSLSPSPDGRSMLTVTDDGLARVWDKSGQEQWQTILGQRATAALFDWNTRRLSIVSGTQEVTRWTLWENDDRQILPVSSPLTLRRGLAGEAFFYGSPSGQITILNRDGSTRRHNFGTMMSIAFSEDGKRAAILRRTIGEQFTLTVMEANSANEFGDIGRIDLQRPPGFDDEARTVRVVALAFSPNARYVLVSVSTSIVPALTVLYDVDNRKQSGTTGSDRTIRTIGATTTDGHVIVRNMDGAFVDWDPRTGVTRPITLPGNTKSPGVVAASHDGKLLVVATTGSGTEPASNGYDLHVLRWPDLSVVRSWKYQGSISRLAFSNGDRYIAAAAVDMPLRVWDVGTGEELARIQSSDIPTQLKFSADDRHVIVASRTMLRRFLWSPADLVSELCRRGIPNLSEPEWDKYIDEKYRPNLASYRCVCPCQ